MKKVIYVSPDGKDTGNGSSAAPFATIDRARAAARLAGPGTKVILRPGEFLLPYTVRFDKTDSGITYEAASPGKTTVSAMRRITDWHEDPDGLWSAPVPWVTSREKGFRILFADGVERPRARLPKSGAFFTAAHLDMPEGVDWFTWNHNTPRHEIEVSPGDIPVGTDIDGAELTLFHFWVDSHVTAESAFEKDGKTFVRIHEPLRRSPSDAPFTLENHRSLISEPGEWALDHHRRRVYYFPKPGDDIKRTVIMVPWLPRFFEINCATDMVFRGIRFEGSQADLGAGDVNDFQAACSIGAAISLTAAERCVFENCAFENIGGYGVEMLHSTRDCKVSRCTFSGLGAGAVHIDSGLPGKAKSDPPDPLHDAGIPDPRRIAAGNEVSDCEIGDYGREFRSACGVLSRNAERTRVIHNHIHDGYYTGVSCGWVWGYMPSVSFGCEISHNHIHDIGKGLLSDMGGIYTLGVSPGTLIDGNHIHDIEASVYGGWGIYNDEGSTGVVVENNLVYDTKFACYHMHYGRDCIVRNNIFAGGRMDQIARTRREDHISFVFYCNIVYWTQGKLHSGNWNDEEFDYRDHPDHTRRLRKTVECDWNIYHSPNLRRHDIRFGTGLELEEWRALGQDEHSFLMNPRFADPAHHDYTLHPLSPAFKVGFHPFDISKAGPRP